MPFIIAAGFVASRTSVLSSTQASVEGAQPAPRVQQMGTRHGYDCLLSRISSGMCENATKAHRRELERLGRRAADACRFGDRNARWTVQRSTLGAGNRSRLVACFRSFLEHLAS